MAPIPESQTDCRDGTLKKKKKKIVCDTCRDCHAPRRPHPPPSKCCTAPKCCTATEFALTFSCWRQPTARGHILLAAGARHHWQFGRPIDRCMSRPIGRPIDRASLAFWVVIFKVSSRLLIWLPKMPIDATFSAGDHWHYWQFGQSLFSCPQFRYCEPFLTILAHKVVIFSITQIANSPL